MWQVRDGPHVWPLTLKRRNSQRSCQPPRGPSNGLIGNGEGAHWLPDGEDTDSQFRHSAGYGDRELI